MQDATYSRAHAVSIDVEQNSRGTTYSVTVRDDSDELALARLAAIKAVLDTTYGPAAGDAAATKKALPRVAAQPHPATTLPEPEPTPTYAADDPRAQ